MCTPRLKERRELAYGCCTIGHSHNNLFSFLLHPEFQHAPSKSVNKQNQRSNLFANEILEQYLLYNASSSNNGIKQNNLYSLQGNIVVLIVIISSPSNHASNQQ